MDEFPVFFDIDGFLFRETLEVDAFSMDVVEANYCEVGAPPAEVEEPLYTYEGSNKSTYN
jgi:hypothetical protein